MIINNQKVFEFYQKNTNLNFEQVNLLCIELFENILQNNNLQNNNSITSQILNECLKNNHKLDEINYELSGKIDKLNSDLILKFFDIKKDYVQEVKNIIQIQEHEKIEKINIQIQQLKEFIQKDNSIIIDKHTIENNKIVNEIIQINNQAVDKINHAITENNTKIVDKITSYINSTVMQINPNIQEQIHKFTDSISDEFKKCQKNIQDGDSQDLITLYNGIANKQDQIIQELDKNTNNQHVLNFINTFEIKYNSLLINILQSSNKQENNQEKIFASIEEFLDRYRNNSSSKGKFAENHLKLILEENIENAEIIDKSQTPHSCDLLLHRCNRQDILIENKVYTHKIPTSEINKFKSDCTKENTHGIILSQFSKITLKYNYQIDIEQIHNGKKIILVYVSDVNEEFHKIQIAINIIDILADYFYIHDQQKQENTQFKISKEIIQEINQEFKKIIIQKENILLLIKDFTKKITLSIEEIKLPALQKYINIIIPLPQIQIQTLECNRCKKFNAKNKSALVAHQKSKECNKIFTQQILLEGGQQIQDN